MGDRKFRPQTKLTPILKQIAVMEKLFPQFNFEWIKNQVVWTGEIQPTEMSWNYTLKIRYSLSMFQPEVWVVSPRLEKRADSKFIPHTYAEDRLCLFRPRKKEWTKAMYIAETIIPWASMWLYYYELWLATGEWRGGGEHPIRKKRGRRINVQDSRD